MVINKLVIKRPQVTTVEQKSLILSLPYLGNISLQRRTKLRKPFKSILNCCKLQTPFKSLRKLANFFRFKDRLSFDGERDRHLKVRCGEHIGISPLTFRKVKPSKESAIRDRLLNDNNIPLLDEFTILTYGHRKYILESKKSCSLSVIDLS